MFRGTIDGTSVYPREVVKEALAVNAAAVILAHNHPSGVAEPSQADERITRRLKSALELVDIRLLDHLIIGAGRATSLASRWPALAAVSRARHRCLNCPLEAGIKTRSLPAGRGQLLFKIKGLRMSKVCQVTGKRPQTGNNVSHAHNKTRRRFLPNLQSKRFWLESEKRFVRLRVSHKGVRIIDKHGIEKVVADLRADGQHV